MNALFVAVVDIITTIITIIAVLLLPRHAFQIITFLQHIRWFS